MSLLFAALFLGASRAGAFDTPELKALRAEVEVASSTHAWAGAYSNGGGLSGRVVLLAPSGRYCGQDWSDIGDSEPDCGTVATSDGTRFSIVEGRPWERRGPPWTLVRWAERRYLVPDARLLDFVNDLNRGWEPSYDRSRGGTLAAYLHDEDDERPAYGVPALPEPYRSYYRAEPVFARAVEIGKREHVIRRVGRREEEECKASARFDKGSSDGVFVGMKLMTGAVKDSPDAVIQKVSEGASEGYIEQDDCERYDEVPVGTIFSSRAPWHKRVALSSEPLTIEIRLLTKKRFPPFAFGHPDELYFAKEILAQMGKHGFSWEEVAEVTAKSTVPGVLPGETGYEAFQSAVLAAGGNAMDRDVDESGALAEKLGVAQAWRAKVYRISFEGRALDTESYFSLDHKDWAKTVREARVATCARERAEQEGKRSAVLALLRWDEAMLRRLHEVRFEELSEERARAVEALVPVSRRRGRVWPQLVRDREKSPFVTAVWLAGFEAQQAFDKANPAEAAACKKLEEAKWGR